MKDLRIAAVRLACRTVEAALGFYVAAFGCRETASGNGTRALLLGAQRLEFMPATQDGGPSPPSNATAFQHCAIIVSNMDEAMQRLGSVPGWTAISLDGPERLPEASGGARAFKFRDPDGHPLELLEFAPDKVPAVWRHSVPGPFLGIDHSAITVSDTDQAIAFWRELGFEVTERHTNRGPEQARMDGLHVPHAIVEVTTLMPPGGAPPHLELLCYAEPDTLRERAADGSRFATSLLLRDTSSWSGSGADPDGHRFSFQA
ncbi:VOC family protein [Aureimonas sp. AU40]|uniref:VOC family protein n=1 Tax=Aureimonas sp. AU40 TaxID=1637747 RepID=UPI000781002D|nr:VOC family protein [Aureimonas sp. AU40]